MIRRPAFFLLLLFVGFDNCGSAPADTLEQIPEKLKSDIHDSIVCYKRFTDTLGRHIVFLTRSHKVAADGKETISLKVLQFSELDSNWTREWIIKDWVDCRNLDIEAYFHKDSFRLTDLDSNGILETSVAYAMTCTGGIEPKSTKVIMRQGETKYAVRGQSLVRISDDVVYGGEFKVDAMLKDDPRFYEFLLNTWKTVAGYKTSR